MLNFQSVRLQTLAIQPIRSSHVIPQHETRSKKTMENTDERLICEVQKFNCLYNQTRSDYKDQKKKENSWNVIGEAVGRDGKHIDSGRFTINNGHTVLIFITCSYYRPNC